MTCRHFQITLENYLESHAEPPLPPITGESGRHMKECPSCAVAFDRALRSRRLLHTLRQDASPYADAYFLTRLRARIEAASEPRPAWPAVLRPGRELLVASCLFLLTLGTFVYNVHRVEAPSIGEAIALDAPHVHARHPNLDHHLRKVDLLLSVLTR